MSQVLAQCPKEASNSSVSERQHTVGNHCFTWSPVKSCAWIIIRFALFCATQNTGPPVGQGVRVRLGNDDKSSVNNAVIAVLPVNTGPSALP